MSKIEIEKIVDKIEVDTKAEGCWTDCFVGYSYSGYTEAYYNEVGWACTKTKKYSAKTCWFW